MKRVALSILLAVFVLLAAALILFGLRRVQTQRQVEAEGRSALPAAPALAATSRLQIIPLYEEASADSRWISGHGVSYLIRTDTASILLDVGHNPDALAAAPFAQNMQALDVPWHALDAVVISHPHPDHVGGTDAWWRHTISFGELPGGVGAVPVYTPIPMAYSGGRYSAEPTLVAPDAATTGVLSYPEVFPLSLFEAKGREEALVVEVAGQGLVLITGCGHPGLEPLVTRAEALYGMPVVGVVGGLHYENIAPEALNAHIQFLQSRSIRLAALSPHDSSAQAMDAFQAAFADGYHTLRVGEAVQFP